MIEQSRRVYDADYISPTIHTQGGGNQEIKIVEPVIINRPHGFNAGSVNYEQSPTLTAGGKWQNNNFVAEPTIGAIRGRNPDDPTSRNAGEPTQQMLEIKPGGTSNAVTTVQKDNVVIEPPLRIRKLTPRETWRLMGFLDEDFDKAAAVNSNSQLYKQAGNSIVVDILEAIFREMLG
jgi:DNA (cytosine-5)-methyltransferase 1